MVFSIATPALAQAPTPVRIRGAIESDGRQRRCSSNRARARRFKIALADNVGVNAVVPIALNAVDSGKFIGAAAMKMPDGTMRALEVLVFPEAMRGAGEGHYPWDLQPESTMTNATVAAVVNANAGRELTVTYKGESLKMLVPADAPIVTFEPADRSLLKPGAPCVSDGAARRRRHALRRARRGRQGRPRPADVRRVSRRSRPAPTPAASASDQRRKVDSLVP